MKRAKALAISLRMVSRSISAISVQFTLKMRVPGRNREKFTKNPSSGGSRSFKVIDVDKFKKPVTSACYNKQHVCAYLQQFSRYRRYFR